MRDTPFGVSYYYGEICNLLTQNGYHNIIVKPFIRCRS